MVTTFHDKVNINYPLNKQLLSKLPHELFFKIIIIYDSDKNVAIRSLKRGDAALGCKHLSYREWLCFAKNNRKNFEYLESLLNDKITCVIRSQNKLNILREKLNINI
jgi:hypothetical protein